MRRLLFFFVFMCSVSILNAQWEQTSVANGMIESIAVNGTNIYAGLQGGGVYRSTDYGSTWDAPNFGLTGNAMYILALTIKGDSVFAGTQGDGVYLSTNSGYSWTEINTGLPEGIIIESMTSNEDDIYAGTYYPDNYFVEGIYKSSNSGQLWTLMNNGLTYDSVYGYPSIGELLTNGINIIAGMNCCGIYLSSNNGGLWSAINTGLTNYDVTSLCGSGSTIFAGTGWPGGSGTIFRSLNSGSTWDSTNTGLPSGMIVNAIAISGNYIFIGDMNYGVFLSMDNGNNWNEVNSGLTDKTVLSFAICANYIFAGTNSGIWKRPLSQMSEIEEIINSEFLVYPNPANDKLTIETLSADKNSWLFIYNMQGQMLTQIELQQTKTDIDISEFESGIYVIRALTEDGIRTWKFVKE